MRSQDIYADQLGTSSNSRAFEIESWSYVQHENYDLHLLHKSEPLSHRRPIPASKYQRLTYYRIYASTPYKTHILCLQHTQFQRFIWSYVFNLLFKALPSTYLHLFLSSYASDQHLHVSKMVPLCYGQIWLVVLASFFELATAADLLTRYLDFIIFALLNQKPWNSCLQPMTKVKIYDVKCYEVEMFRQAILKGNVTQFGSGFFNSSSGELFQMAPVLFIRSRYFHLDHMEYFRSYFSIYYVLVWVIAGLAYNQLFRASIWKFLNTIHWMKNVILMTVLLHILYSNLENERPEPLVEPQPTQQTINIYDLLWQTDIDFLGESNTAPPVVHILTSRSSHQNQIHPGLESALIQTSTGIYFILKGLVTHVLRRYCEDRLRAPVQVFYINPFPWFFLWPIYFSMFRFGHICTFLFFSITFIIEMVAFIITYQCLVEVVVCEWPRIRRWIFSVFITVLAFVMCIVLNWKCRQLFYIYSKAICTLLEYLVLIFLYPVGRLLDDITFHYGTRPNTIRIWSIKLVPVYYSVKVYLMVNGFIGLLKLMGYEQKFKYYIWAYAPSFVPLVLGLFFVIGKQLIWKKQHWRTLFRPVPQWGPRDHIQRQLRKQYDSREYVNSQSSRYLSRYLVANAEAPTYKLDICYERPGPGQRSTFVAEQFSAP